MGDEQHPDGRVCVWQPQVSTGGGSVSHSEHGIYQGCISVTLTLSRPAPRHILNSSVHIGIPTPQATIFTALPLDGKPPLSH